MKISKSKQELARIISENSGWRDGADWAAQDGDGGIGGYEVKPEWDSLAKYWWREASGQWFLANKIKNHHQTVLSRAEYLHLYPVPDADGWIEYNGEGSPYSNEDVVEAKWTDGDFTCGDNFGPGPAWLVERNNPNITHHRLHKPEQAKPEFCESVMRSIPEPEAKPTIEQLVADYRDAKDYADRKQQEADDAKADADARLKALELASEAIGLLVSPITEKQERELVIADWRDLRVGDEIKVTGFDGDIAEKQRCDDLLDADSCTVVKQGDHVEIEITGKHNGKSRGWLLDGNVKTKWRLIRRQ